MPDTPPTRSLFDRLKLPPGVLPQHLHAWASVIIALLVVLVVAFSNRTTPKPVVSTPLPPAAIAVDPNEDQIRAYRDELERKTQELRGEQARLQAVQHATVEPALGARGASGLLVPETHASADTYAGGGTPTRDWQAVDRDRRQESRYASSVAKTRRTERSSTSGAPTTAPNDSATSATNTGELSRAHGPRYHLLQGSVIETVLTNRLDSSFAGPINCMVTSDVYARNRHTLLIPQGTRVLGSVHTVESLGQQRLAVTFERLIMPDGFSVDLATLPGMNAAGETGLRDRVDHHYGQLFGVSLAVGAIAGLSQAGSAYGPGTSGFDAYRQGVAGSLSQSALNILDRYLNIMPTFQVREGHRIRVWLTGDLLLPAYENHDMPADL